MSQTLTPLQKAGPTMRLRPLLLAVALAIAAGLAGGSASNAALDPTSINVVVVTNRTSDAWAWMTVYQYNLSGIIKAFCVPPHHTKREGISSSAYEVRAEVTAASGCSGRRMLDRLRGYPSGSGHTYTYYIHGSAGHYDYNNTP